jgi:hypothetical protein
MRGVEIHYHETTDFTVTVTPEGRSARTQTVDHASAEDGSLRVGVYAQEYVLAVTNDTPGACNLSSADWEAIRVVRNRRA